MTDPSDDPPVVNGRARWAFLSLGWVCLLLGLAGAALPLVPGTLFLLVALWAFARSSRRFHDWLYHHRHFGPPLREYREYRVIPVRAKMFAVGGMAASFLYVTLFTNAPWFAVAPMALLMAVGAVYVLTCPSRRRAV